MPKLKHTVTTDYTPSFRTEKVAGMFDVPITEKLTREWDINLPVEDEDWSIGLILGPSGSGKTTIGKKIFGEDAYHIQYEWDKTRSLLDDFADDLSVRDITDALSHVGLSSPPAWMLPFAKLSNGQQFRAEMARLILESGDISVVDEFTSVVDRQVAKISSYAVQKFVRKRGKKLVALSCHDDIKEWLEPDWVYQVDTDTFTRGRLRRPEIKVKLFRCHYSAWRIFRGHHYLTADINHSARCFIGMIDDKPAAFVAALPFPHPKFKNGMKMWRGHRTVVLPDYQGIRLGNTLSDAIGDYFHAQNCRYTSLTSHPAMIAYRIKSPKWIMTRKAGQVNPSTSKGKLGTSSGRMTISFEYIGDKSRYE